MHTDTGNHMLDGFSPNLRASILDSSDHVSLPQRYGLCAPYQHPQYLYFPIEGLCSTVVSMEGGGSAEGAMYGKESLVGAHTLLGPQVSPTASIVQIAGEGVRIPRRVAEALFAHSEEFRSRVLALIQMAMYVSLQTSACGLLHEAEQRLARWLLMSADRTESPDLPLTQDFLAEMLGTQRTTVALVAGELRRKGLIEYVRGHVTILDRNGLMNAACECYGVSRAGIERLKSEEVGA